MSSKEQKKLQKDGVVSDDELQISQAIEEMEIKEEKAEAQKNGMSAYISRR